MKTASILICLALCGCATGEVNPNNIAYLRGTKQYERRVASFTLTEARAHDLLIKAAKNHPHAFFDPWPRFVWGNEYSYGIPTKVFPLPLTGFYVDGMTGHITYRTSTNVMHKATDQFSNDVFSSIEELK